MWIALKVMFLAFLMLIVVMGFWLVLTGERLKTRYAASGLVVLPMFGLFYAARFSEIQRSTWSVLAHLVAVASVVFIGTCLLLHSAEVIDATQPPLLWLLCTTILTFAVSVGAIAHFAGYKRQG